MRRALWITAAVLALGIVPLSFVSLARAGTPAADCTAAAAWDQGLCVVVAGRLDALAAEPQVVTLAEVDERRLDLVWWGVWFSFAAVLGGTVGSRTWQHVKGWGS